MYPRINKNTLKSRYLGNSWSWGVDTVIDNGKQAVTLTFKVQGQSHSATEGMNHASQCHTRRLSQICLALYLIVTYYGGYYLKVFSISNAKATSVLDGHPYLYVSSFLW